MKNQIEFSVVLSTLEEIKTVVCQYIDSKVSNLEINIKDDNSIVTDVDLFISNLFKERFIKIYPFLNYFSEEDQESFEYPMIILDPIDGTKELAKGIGECSISFGIYFSGQLDDSRNFSWIFNPFNGICIHSEETYMGQKTKDKSRLIGLVSNTEFEKGMHKSNEVYPIGSIAYKLGLLSKGIGDYVLTKKPKNIWDIMAGTHIAYKRNLKCYVDGTEIKSIESQLISAPIIWGSEEIISKMKYLNS